MAAFVAAYWQDAVVTAIAFGGVATILWRVFGVLGGEDKPTACANCASGRDACAPSAPGDTHPAVFIRSAR